MRPAGPPAGPTPSRAEEAPAAAAPGLLPIFLLADFSGKFAFSIFLVFDGVLVLSSDSLCAVTPEKGQKIF